MCSGSVVEPVNTTAQLENFPNTHQTNNTEQHPTNKVLRKQFRPTEEQKRILEADHINGVTADIINQRAIEFHVHTTQVKSWHKRFN